MYLIHRCRKNWTVYMQKKKITALAYTLPIEVYSWCAHTIHTDISSLITRILLGRPVPILDFIRFRIGARRPGAVRSLPTS